MSSIENFTVRRKTPDARPRIEDCVGTAKKFLKDIQASIDGAGIFDALGVSPNTSYLLAGQHGTGKSHCLEALNNEYNKEAAKIDAQKLHMKLQEHNQQLSKKNRSSDKEILRQTNQIYAEAFRLNMMEYRIGEHGTAYINIGSKILQKFFNIGRQYAEKGKPTVLVFDEADQIMSKRGGNSSHKEDDKLISTLMKNLQEIQDIPNLFTVFLTNFPKSMDNASIRAGRIDKRYNFKLPNLTNRKQLLRSIIKQRNDAAGYQVIRNVDIPDLADAMEGFTNADIDQVLKEAIRKRAREMVRDRDDELIVQAYVTQVRILRAAKKHRSKFQLDRSSIGFNE